MLMSSSFGAGVSYSNVSAARGRQQVFPGEMRVCAYHTDEPLVQLLSQPLRAPRHQGVQALRLSSRHNE